VIGDENNFLYYKLSLNYHIWIYKHCDISEGFLIRLMNHNDEYSGLQIHHNKIGEKAFDLIFQKTMNMGKF
jgi:hypothetical protein